MNLAWEEQRIPLTEDKDFGWLSFVARMDSPGVILIRFPASARSMVATGIQRLVAKQGSRIETSFVVVQPGLVRFGPRSES